MRAATGADTLHITASDSRGGVAAPAAVAVTVNAPPAITAPAAVTIPLNQATAIAGVSLTDPDAVSAGETLTATLTDANGLLIATGAGVSGSGTTSLTITGSLAQVNADLATLKDQDATFGDEDIYLNATDSRGGVAAGQVIDVTVAGPPVIAAPGAVTLAKASPARSPASAFRKPGPRPARRSRRP